MKHRHKQIGIIGLIGLCLFFVRSSKAVGFDRLCSKIAVESVENGIENDLTISPKATLRSQSKTHWFNRLQFTSFRKFFSLGLLPKGIMPQGLNSSLRVDVKREVCPDWLAFKPRFSRAPPPSFPG